MKKIFVSVLPVLFAVSVNMSAARGDTIFNKRKSAVENLEAFKSSIVDSTKDVLKELVKMQDEVIAADKPVIEVYLDSLKTKADSLYRTANNLANDKNSLGKDVKTKADYILYGLIVCGVLFVLFVIFFVLFLVTSAKKNKFRKQLGDIDKMREANRKEIELARKEVELLKANAQKEIAIAKENVDKEVKNLKAKIDSQNAEKANLEKRIDDKTYLIDDGIIEILK